MGPTTHGGPSALFPRQFSGSVQFVTEDREEKEVTPGRAGSLYLASTASPRAVISPPLRRRSLEKSRGQRVPGSPCQPWAAASASTPDGQWRPSWAAARE